VTDTGSGIHPDDLPRIFDRYYQSRRPDAPTQGGTGIGLSLCREYCALWGGTLTVSSEWGQGTVAAFTVPALPVAVPSGPSVSIPAVTSAVAQTEANNPASQQDTVLVVEDNPDMLDYLQLLLAPRYAFRSFSSGLTAWQWLQTQPTSHYPQAIVTDLMMPDMDGLALFENLRTHPDLQAIPVLMLTARTDVAVRDHALQLGVADYMTKPFDAEELHTRLQNLLERADERTYWRNQPTDPDPTDISPEMSDKWLQTLADHIRNRLTDPNFTVDDLATVLHMSRSQLYRRVKERSGLSPVAFVQEIRLQMAYGLLKTESCKTLKEITFAVGFQKSFYFKELFQKRFGINPVSLFAHDSIQVPPAS
jgi:DNA-binding response OmpR family regulator